MGHGTVIAAVFLPRFARFAQAIARQVGLLVGNGGPVESRI